MRKVLVAMAAVLLALSIAWAQQQPTTSDSDNNTPAKSGSQVTVRGCLGGSPGDFTLLGSDGTTYKLNGNDDQLKDHVGHTVAVTGTVGTGNTTTTNATESSPNGASPSETTGEQRTLSVSSLKHISASCGAASSTGRR